MRRNDTPLYEALLSGRPWLVALALLFVTVAVYARCAAFDFQYEWDDAFYVVDNPLIRSVSFTNLGAVFTRTFQGHYSPLVFVSYQIEYLLGGAGPAVFHFGNVLLHAVNVALCFLLVRALSARTGLALLTALVFALHPVNVEAVAWIAQRKTLLASTFALLSLLAYLRWSVAARAGWFVASIFFFLCALASKSSIIGLPVLLIALEWQRGSDFKRIATRTGAFLMLASLFALITVLGFRSADVVQKTDAKLLFGTIYPTSLALILDNLRLLFWPTRLSAFYDTVLYDSYLAPRVLGGLLLLGGATLLLLLRGAASMRFWFLWALCFFLPNSNLVPLQTFYADRYLYLPLIGVTAGLLLGIEHIGQKLMPRLPLGRIALWGAIPLLGLMLLLSWQRCDVWRNEISLWQDTAEKSPNLYKARLNHAVALEKARRHKDAVDEYGAAVRIYPDPAIITRLKILRAMNRNGAPATPLRP
jgi:hypothetical protein